MKLLDTILENIELDEARPSKTNQEWVNEFKSKFPNYNYSNAKFFRDDNNLLKVKNVYCNIHKHNFPEKGGSEGISVFHHLNGTGCLDCGKERKGEKLSVSEKEWREILPKIKHLKDKCDFSKSKFSFVKPMKNGPLVTNTFCKIHKKYFNGGPNNEGIGAQKFKQYKNVCPDCIKNADFDNKVRSVEDWSELFKSNKLNKNYDYSKSKVFIEGSKTNVYNIYCNVKGLNGKKHGVFAKDGVNVQEHKLGYHQCPKCECETKQKDFIKRATEKHGNKYVYDKVDFCDDNNLVRKEGLRQIKNYRKVLIGCKIHGYFSQEEYSHKTGRGCPICRESKGELYIGNLLSKLKIKFIREKKFTESGNMEFDFYIPKLNVAIEYDGEQHFYPVFGTSDYSINLNYNNTVNRDNLKNKFIKSNVDGVRLIRVPYTMEFSEIDTSLLEAIENTLPNQISKIGNYPKRKGTVTPTHPKKMEESKLSLIGILNQLSSNE
jgi:very-short-patch-repair endonuclease